MIYIIRDALSGHVKIGVSAKPWARFANLRVSCPGELSMRAIVPGDRVAEQALHRRFAEHRVRGEWFRCDGALAVWVMALPLPEKPAGAGPVTWGDSGLTDDDLAPIAGISRAHLCKIRHGKCMPGLGVALKIADATGIDVRSMLQAQPPRSREEAA